MKHQVFIVWFIIFILWAIYRANVFLPEWVDEFFFKPLIFVGPVLWVVLFREKKKLSDIGLASHPRAFFLDLYIGVVIGIIFALEALFANYIKYGTFSFTTDTAVKFAGGIVPFIIINLATSFSEEVLGRGYLYNRLYKQSKDQFGSALTSSFLFLLLHIPILFTRLHLMGSSLIIYPISILLLGITNCYIYSLRKSLTLPIFLHTFWNMTVALYL